MDKLRIKILQGMEVQREPIEETKRLKSLDEYTDLPMRVLGVPFGGHREGRDSDGEAFHDGTNIGMEIGDSRPITYYHGFGPDDPGKMQDVPALIGRAVYTDKNERGYWFDAYLDRDEPLAQRLIDSDEIKASSGAISHLVRKGDDGILNVWIVGELALFDTNEWRRPANEFAIVEKRSAITEDTKQPKEEDKAGEAVPIQVLEVESDSEIVSIELENIKESTMDEIEEVKALTREDVEEMIKASAPAVEKGAPTFIKSRGEKTEMQEFMNFIKTGKGDWSSKALNDTTMNIATDADGGFLVPDPVYQSVWAKANAIALDTRLGVTDIPGIGTTISVPVDATTDGAFTIATESQEFGDDAPILANVTMTYKKYAKIIRITHELLRDEDAKLLPFIENWVARGVAKTKNALLVAEVEANGSLLTTFASATTVAGGELEVMVYDSEMVDFLEGGRPAWVMAGPTYAKIASLSGNPRTYVPTPQGDNVPAYAPDLISYPVYFSGATDLTGATNKSVLFGDWTQVGVRNGNGLQMIRDPYTRARWGEVEFVFLFDVVYAVLNANGIGYGLHPTA